MGIRPNNRIGGVIVPMVTPIKYNKSHQFIVDETASDKLLDQLILHGAQTIFLFGYAGGCDKGLLLLQRKAHLVHVLQHLKNKIPVVVGISHQNLDAAVKLARHAETTNVAAMVLLLNQSLVDYQHQVETILNATTVIPLILYNNPYIGQRRNLTPADVKPMILNFPGRIIGLKESSGDEATFISFIKFQHELAAKQIPFDLFMGDAQKISWIIKNQHLHQFTLPGAVPVEANIPQKTATYVQLISGINTNELEYLSIPKTIDTLIDQKLIDPASTTFWNSKY